MVYQTIAVEKCGEHGGFSGASVKSLPQPPGPFLNPLCTPDLGVRVESGEGALVPCHNAAQKVQPFSLESLQMLLTKFLPEFLLIFCKDPGDKFGTDMPQSQILAQNSLNCGSRNPCLLCNGSHRLPSVLLNLVLHFGDVLRRSARSAMPTPWCVLGQGLQIALEELLVPVSCLCFPKSLLPVDTLQLSPTVDGRGTLGSHEFDDSTLLDSTLHGHVFFRPKTQQETLENNEKATHKIRRQHVPSWIAEDHFECDRNGSKKVTQCAIFRSLHVGHEEAGIQAGIPSRKNIARKRMSSRQAVIGLF